ncbi:MAG: hypothetical protein SGPRY_004705 [Prymnesium sp.]
MERMPSEGGKGRRARARGALRGGGEGLTQLAEVGSVERGRTGGVGEAARRHGRGAEGGVLGEQRGTEGQPKHGGGAWIESFVPSHRGPAVDDVRNALLHSRHNPRRALVRPIELASNNARATDFVTKLGTQMLCSRHVFGEDATWLESMLGNNECTDFVIMGEAEAEDPHCIDLSMARYALLASEASPRRGLRRPVQLNSNANKCTDFFMMPNKDGILCSTDLKSADIAWIEKLAGLRPGKLFEQIRQANSGTLSPCELAWEPLTRYQAMARLTREPRGSKSVEHLRNLRRSDPTISLNGWHDWRALYAGVRASPLARVQEQAQIHRAHMGRRVEINQETEISKSNAEKDAYVQKSAKQATWASKSREERTSANSVISYLDSDLEMKNTPFPMSPATIHKSLEPTGKYASWTIEGAVPPAGMTWSES